VLEEAESLDEAAHPAVSNRSAAPAANATGRRRRRRDALPASSSRRSPGGREVTGAAEGSFDGSASGAGLPTVYGKLGPAHDHLVELITYVCD
jgi:hypothetical protein